MVVISVLGLRRGVDIEVNQVGRWGVWPTMFSLFLAMVSVTWVADLLLYIGLAMMLAATVLYVRDGLRVVAQPPSSSA
jgi:cardiolipin synthase